MGSSATLSGLVRPSLVSCVFYFLNLWNLVLHLQELKILERLFINFPFARLHWVFISLHSCLQSLQFSVQTDFNSNICFPCHRIVRSSHSLHLVLDSLKVLQVRQWWAKCLEKESDISSSSMAIIFTVFPPSWSDHLPEIARIHVFSLSLF